ncbi:MAG TPA: hypothetical protein VLM38_16600 [Blastocatellia bacterium]|nr:hypothetical protein [Blastocatellia bacterium]
MIHKPLTVSFLVAVLTLALTPGPASAGGSSSERPIRLFATATAGPIGTAQTLSPLSINGRVCGGEQVIWGGETLQTFGTGAQLDFDQIGTVALARDTLARFASARTVLEDDTSGSVLIVSLISGVATLKLGAGAGAYVEAAGSVFTASRGAKFKLAVQQGHAALTTIAGKVTEDQLPQADLKIQVVDELGRPVASGSQLSVRARASRQIQVRVTDKDDRPVPDAPVIFLLGGQGGTLGTGTTAGTSVTVATNAQGIATTSFTAGPASGSTSVTATVAGTNASTTVGVSTTVAAGIFTGTTLGIVAAAVAGGTLATVVAVRQAQNNKEPVTALPPNITPKP